MDWHPATVRLRSNIYYVVLTIPCEARTALDGQKQLRALIRTSDHKTATQRKQELEVRLRNRVESAMNKHRLTDKSGHDQTAIASLGIGNMSYHAAYT